MLELQNIVKSFDGVQVIKGVSLKIQNGEFISLLGPSGCGKTTCLRMIAGFEQQDSGHIILDGKVLDNVPPYKRPLNTLFQNYALFPHMTVFDNIAYGLKMHNEKKLLIKEKVMEAIKMVRLEGFEKRYPCELSGGQRQRVAIARAVVNHPPILLLDEPLTALDAKLRIEMRYELRSLQKKLGITFIYVTHDQEEALVMSDRIVVMNKGVIEQSGTPSNIYYNPETKFVSSFIGETNLFDAVVDEANGITMELEGEAGCCIADDNDCFKQGEIVNVSIRPDKILWSKTPVEDFSFVGKVTDVVFSGAATKVFVELANGAEFKITRLSAEKLPQPGDELYLSWKSSDCVVIHSISQEFTSTIQNIDLGRWVREITTI